MSVHDDFYLRSDSSATAEAERAEAQVQGVQVAFRHFSFVLVLFTHVKLFFFIYFKIVFRITLLKNSLVVKKKNLRISMQLLLKKSRFPYVCCDVWCLLKVCLGLPHTE